MRLPALLSRRKKKVHKNKFGHILILAGSRNMLGAACLSGLAAMRSGAGLVTLGIPKSFNSIVQKKISSVIMTFPLEETLQQTLAFAAFSQIQKKWQSFDVMALGPGLSQHSSTQRLIQKIVETAPQPLVIDADAIRAIALNPKILRKTSTTKILTPHLGEMALLTRVSKSEIEANRRKTAKNFAMELGCILVLKGHHTVVASPDGTVYINKTGNPGMATAGSGDVLTGMIAAFCGQGLSGFDAAKYAVYFHGMAGDLAAEEKGRLALIATDIIEHIPMAVSLRSIADRPAVFLREKKIR